MNKESKMKVLIEVDRKLWARLIYYATMNELRYGEAVDKLLREALAEEKK